MSDSWLDTLLGITGAGAGFVQGFDKGLAPFKTWEGIRTTDLANDRFETGNRDILLEQEAREGLQVPQFYGDEMESIRSGFNKVRTGNAVDIFGNEQKLALQQYLTDPNQGFQQGIAATGWTPGTPEYREWLAEAINQFDPTGAITQYDKMNIPGLRQDNLDQQATVEYLQNWVRQNGPDPNAEVVRFPDGTMGVRDSKTGEMHPIEIPGGGNALVRAAAMSDAKTPYTAISGALADETKIQAGNTAFLKSQNEGKLSPSVMFNYAKDRGVRIDAATRIASGQLQTLQKKDTGGMTPEEREAHNAEVQRLQGELQQLQTASQQNIRMLDAAVNSGGASLPGRGAVQTNTRFGQPPGTPPAKPPVAKNTASIEQVTQQAAGPRTLGGRDSYTDRRAGARSTGQQRITPAPQAAAAPPQGDPQQKMMQLVTYMQSMGVPPDVIARAVAAMAGG